MKRIGAIFMAAVMMMMLCSCGNHVAGQDEESADNNGQAGKSCCTSEHSMEHAMSAYHQGLLHGADPKEVSHGDCVAIFEKAYK